MSVQILKRLKIKRRSLPNQKNSGKYFGAVTAVIVIFIVYNFIHIIFTDGFLLVFPKIIYPLIFFAFYTIYQSIERDFRNASQDDMIKIVSLIQMNHIQTLTEELSEKPEMLSHKYKNKSLLYWARHYKNNEANSLIIKLLRNKEN